MGNREERYLLASTLPVMEVFDEGGSFLFWEFFDSVFSRVPFDTLKGGSVPVVFLHR